MTGDKVNRFEPKEQQEIKDLFMEILNVNDLSKVTVKALHEVL